MKMKTITFAVITLAMLMSLSAYGGDETPAKAPGKKILKPAIQGSFVTPVAWPQENCTKDNASRSPASGPGMRALRYDLIDLYGLLGWDRAEEAHRFNGILAGKDGWVFISYDYNTFQSPPEPGILGYRPETGESWEPPGIDVCLDRGGKIYTIDAAGYLRGYSPDRELLWLASLDSAVDYDLLAVSGQVYIHYYSGTFGTVQTYLECRSASNGVQIWKKGPGTDMAPYGFAIDPWDNIIFTYPAKDLHKLNKAGVPVWSITYGDSDFHNPGRGPILGGDGRILATLSDPGSSGARYYILDADGAILSETTTEARPEFACIGSDGNLIIAYSNDEIVSYNAADWTTPVWTKHIPGEHPANYGTLLRAMVMDDNDVIYTIKKSPGTGEPYYLHTIDASTGNTGVITGLDKPLGESLLVQSLIVGGSNNLLLLVNRGFLYNIKGSRVIKPGVMKEMH